MGRVRDRWRDKSRNKEFSMIRWSGVEGTVKMEDEIMSLGARKLSLKLLRIRFNGNCGQSLWSNSFSQWPMGLERRLQKEVKTGLDTERAKDLLNIVTKTDRPGSKMLWVWVMRQSCLGLNVT